MILADKIVNLRKKGRQPSIHIKVGRRTVSSGYEQNFKTFRSISCKYGLSAS